MASGEFQTMNRQRFEVSIDPDPYRLENGEKPRVVMQGEQFFFNLSPRTAISLGIELIRCAYHEMDFQRRHLEKKAEKSAPPTDKSW